jgi:N-acetyl-anhydromuramyl-L-alanine amidase AmpD
MTVDQIRRDHIKNNHWSDIGYQYVVYLDGTVHIGRDVDIAGAHAEGHNSCSIGVAYVGGLENDPKKKYTDLKAKDTRTDEQKAALISLLMDLRKLYPMATIHGHRDFANKACPSFDATHEYRKF